MRYFNARSLTLTAGLLLTLQAAVAQEPPMPVPSSDGLANTAYGTGSLSSLNTTNYPNAVQNSAFGDGALLENLGGTQNTAVGYQASYSNQSGSFNTSVGWAALWQNDSGSFNTGMGYQALENQIGSSNSAFGYNALDGATQIGAFGTGSSNTAIGSTAFPTAVPPSF